MRRSERARGQEPIRNALASIGLSACDLIRAEPAGGGCINEAAALHTRRGSFFLKWNAAADHRFFEVEAEGLRALAGAGAARTPRVIGRSTSEQDGAPWLLLEWIEEGRAGRAGWGRLGRELAALHRASPHKRFGWPTDNVIGSLKQPNGLREDWGGFWAERRVLPLARELRGRGAINPDELLTLERAAEAARPALSAAAMADGPSLLHGDLWSGNVLFDRSGEPALIDPAVYVGHREVDLAMCRLFGGFPAPFWEAYRESWPLLPGAGARLGLYQLYPLLVHARLFGGGYASSAVRAAAETL